MSYPFKGDDGIDWDRHVDEIINETWGDYSGVPIFDYFIEGLPENALCLDLGCNISRWRPTFDHYNLRYEGLDASRRAIDVARERYPDTKYYHKNAKDMDFVEKYDLVFTHAVLQHIARPNQKIILGNIFRATKQGGHFVMQEKSDKESETHHTKEIWIKMVEATGFKFIKYLYEIYHLPINGYLFKKGE